MPAKILGRRMQNQIDAELQWPLIKRCCEGGVDERFHAVSPADVREAFEVNDVVVRVGRRFADEHTRGGANRFFHRLIITRRRYRNLDAVAMQHLGEKLPGPAIRIVGYDDVRIVRKHGVQGRRDGGHAAGEEQAVPGTFKGGELLLGDVLGRVAVAPVLLALDASLEVVAQLLSVEKCVGCGLNDRGGERITELWPRLAGVHGEGADAARLLVGSSLSCRNGALAVVFALAAAIHQWSRSRMRST